MATNDTCVTIVPYFKVRSDALAAFKELCEKFVERTRNENGCLYYGFTFDGEEAFCQEGYVNAQALLTHLENVGDLLKQALGLAELVRLEIHGPEQELAQLRQPLAELRPRFFTLEYGFRR
jgi:quinol monooxygenase YgiN